MVWPDALACLGYSTKRENLRWWGKEEKERHFRFETKTWSQGSLKAQLKRLPAMLKKKKKSCDYFYFIIFINIVYIMMCKYEQIETCYSLPVEVRWQLLRTTFSWHTGPRSQTWGFRQAFLPLKQLAIPTTSYKDLVLYWIICIWVCPCGGFVHVLAEAKSGCQIPCC